MPDITPAHTQLERAQYVVFYPEHEPRETDSHYALFNHAKNRIIKAGIGCWICGTLENREIHHSEVEFAVANGIDYERLAADHPEYHITDEETFLAWVEGEGNLLVLCRDCHRSPYRGIHHVDYPNWKAQKYWRKDMPSLLQPVITKVTVSSNSDPAATVTSVTVTASTTTEASAASP